jgi:aryl-alcohol dehydrogenase-like predicted oxidoreductase
MTTPGATLEPPPPVLTPRPIGETGLRAFPIAFDGSVLGWVTGVERAAQILGRFRDAGGTLISTADHYAAGRSEYMIGSWLETVPRDSAIIATKVGRHPDRPGLAPTQIENSVDASLERLRTDHVDLLSLAGDLVPPDPRPVFEVVDRLVRIGKVRHVSAVAVSAAQLRDWGAIADAEGYPRVRAVLAEYNLMTRSAESDLLPVAEAAGLGFLARLPLASGFLTGRIHGPDDLPGNALFDGALQHLGRRGDRVLAALAQVAAEHGVDVATVALAWVLHKPGVTAAVVRAHDLASLDGGFLGSTITLTRHQLGALDAASA